MKGSANADLLEMLNRIFDAIPVVGTIRRRWRPESFANSTILREAKMLLFVELAEAARRDYPLSEAAALAGRPYKQPKAYGDSGDTLSGIGRRMVFLFGWMIALLLLGCCGLVLVSTAFSPIGLVLVAGLMALLGIQLRSARAVCRRIGSLLEDRLASGKSLGAAVAELPLTFNAYERRLIETGEQWGTLPEALTAVVDANRAAIRTSVSTTYFFYPLILLLVAIGPIIFIYERIYPQLEMLTEAVGIQMPLLTEYAMGLFGVGQLLSGVFLAVTVIFLLLIFLRVGIMNGAPGWIGGSAAMTYIVLALLIALVPAVLLITLASGMTDASRIAWASAIFLAAILLPAVLVTPTMRQLEWTIRRGEAAVASIVGLLPGVGRSIDFAKESYWLAALGLGLRVGVPAPDAMRTAGKLVGGKMHRRSDRAAELVESGHSIGGALLRHPVLSTKWNRRVARLDAVTDYPAAIGELQEEVAMEADRVSRTLLSTCEILGILAVAFVLGLIVLSIYLPMFGIPISVY